MPSAYRRRHFYNIFRLTFHRLHGIISAKQILSERRCDAHQTSKPQISWKIPYRELPAGCVQTTFLCIYAGLYPAGYEPNHLPKRLPALQMAAGTQLRQRKPVYVQAVPPSGTAQEASPLGLLFFGQTGALYRRRIYICPQRPLPCPTAGTPGIRKPVAVLFS